MEKSNLIKATYIYEFIWESIRPLMDYYKIDVEDFVVLYDDLDIL